MTIKVMDYDRDYLEDNELHFAYKSSSKSDAVAYAEKMIEMGHGHVVVMKFLNAWEVFRDKY